MPLERMVQSEVNSPIHCARNGKVSCDSQGNGEGLCADLTGKGELCLEVLKKWRELGEENEKWELAVVAIGWRIVPPPRLKSDKS